MNRIRILYTDIRHAITGYIPLLLGKKGVFPIGSSGFLWAIFCIVPRVRFLVKNKKIVHFRTDFRQILSSNPHNFSQSGPIYLLHFVLYDPQSKKTLSRTMKKSESVGEKRVSRSGDRKYTFFGQMNMLDENRFMLCEKYGYVSYKHVLKTFIIWYWCKCQQQKRCVQNWDVATWLWVIIYSIVFSIPNCYRG